MLFMFFKCVGVEINTLGIFYINLLNVANPSVKPNGITRNSYNSKVV